MGIEEMTVSAGRDSYHHGELREALIKASDDILRHQGIESFSLREAARRAGVSPGAPAHHFGNSSGLLTEVALLGYEALARYLMDAPQTGSPISDLRALAKAYVEFALEHPGRFRLMFRRELVNRDDPRYVAASTRAMAVFARAAAIVYGGDPETANHAENYPIVIAAWSTVHGVAHLALEGKLAFALRTDLPRDFSERLLPEILEAQWPD